MTRNDLTSRLKILELFDQKGGIVKLNEITEHGINKYHLLKLIKTGEVQRLNHGIYTLTNYQVKDYAELQRYVSNGIICLFSAWNYYGLTTYIPNEYHIAIEKKTKIKLPVYPPVKLYYWDKSVLSIGKRIIKIDAVAVNIYDLEKSVCDAVKFRNKIGKDILNEVLTEYLRRKDKNIDQLIKYSRLVRIERILKNYLDVLL